jgi:hypothetical protein
MRDKEIRERIIESLRNGDHAGDMADDICDDTGIYNLEQVQRVMREVAELIVMGDINQMETDA